MPAIRLSEMRTYLRNYGRILLKEVSAFGLVGALALVIDVGIFTWLAPHGALKAKAASTVVSTAFAYFGNRYLSFSHRARTGIARETSYFFGINLITLVFSEAIIGFFVYVLGYGHGSRAVFLVNLGTIALGTLFRFWSYKRFVFVHPDRVHAREVDLAEELAE
ncbi:MAG TPA: GtrA family protein [Jatrophihabitans sp.]|nr:GtrA family protein [Jatrophihabitans sp.]